MKTRNRAKKAKQRNQLLRRAMDYLKMKNQINKQQEQFVSRLI